MKRLIISFLLLSMVSIASADKHTCGDWHSFSQEYRKFIGADLSGNQFKAGWYIGYINGWVDSNILELQSGFSQKQAHRVFANWLDNKPEFWHYPVLMCVHMAFDPFMK